MRAAVMNEGVTIRIGIFTSNCRGNVPLISYQIHLLSLHFQGEDHVNFGKAENQNNRVGDLGRKYSSYLSESPVSVSVYASMIIGVMRGCCFSEFSLSIKILLEKRGRQRQDHMNF